MTISNPFANWETKHAARNLADFAQGKDDRVLQRIAAVIEGGFTGRMLGLFGDIGVGKSSLLQLLQRARNCHQRRRVPPYSCGECDGCRAVECQGGSFTELFVRYTSSDSSSAANEIDRNIAFWAGRGNDGFRGGGQFVLGIDDLHFMKWLDPGWLQGHVDRYGGQGILFVVATSAKSVFPPSLLSRCECLELNSPSVDELAKWFSNILIEQEISFEPDFPRWLSREADRRPRTLLNWGWQLSRVARHFTIAEAKKQLF